jgi:hypothetical protein
MEFINLKINKDNKATTAINFREERSFPSDDGFSSELKEILTQFSFESEQDCFLNDSFKEYIFSKNRIHCIAMVTNQDLWHPENESELKSPEIFISATRTLFKYFPEITVPFDVDREIDEIHDSWNMDYLNKQRGLLRYNFSKERLAHMILVYKFLVWNKRLSISNENKVNEQLTVRNEYISKESRQQGKKKWGGMCIIIFICIIIVSIVVLCCMLNKSSVAEKSIKTDSHMAYPKGQENTKLRLGTENIK